MSRISKNEHGFGAVEVVMVLVIVALLGVVGWFVYDRNHNKTTNTSTSTTPATKTTTPTTPKPVDPYAGWKTYNDTKWNYQFKYPSDWIISSRDFVNGGFDTRDVTLKSPNYTSNTASVIEDVTAGAKITVEVNDTNMADFSATGLKESEAYKETTVAGVNAVYYIGRGRAFSYSLIKNKVMYTISLRTVENDTTSENSYMPIFEKLVKSLKPNT